MLKIMGQAQASIEQMRAYIKKVNPKVPESVLAMIPLYITEGALEGVRGDVAFAQSCLETGNFTFTGSAVELNQNNFCGMGVTSNGVKGNSFKTPKEGIRAQIQHLKAYACDDALEQHCIDPRFTYVKRGCAPYVEWLGRQENPSGAGWASGANYGNKIIDILNNILNTEDEREVEKMNIFVCVGHANYGGGVISSADGTKSGGVNEYNYNKALAPYVVKWLKAAGHKATLCIAPEGKLHSLNDEINYFIGLENKGNYDLAVQLHLNAFNTKACGTEAYAYNSEGLKVAESICKKLGTVWKNRGAQIKTGLYWTRKTKAKAVLIESFFCDNREDYNKAKKLGFDVHGKLIAEGILGKSISGSAGNKPTNKPETGGSDKPTGGGYMFKPATVKKGDKNTSALLLQEILRARGFKGKDKKELKLDWEAGENTIYALKEYQKSRKGVLEVDGICGTNTWKDLIAI